MKENEDQSQELMPEAATGALAAIARAEIDSRVATAHAYPRSMAKFKARALEMVSLDEETAESCIYSRPVGKKKNSDGQWVTEFAEGMSIRMAEIVGACYGNIHVGSMLIEQTPRFVRARGKAMDMETGYSSDSEVIESTVTSKGEPFSERMRIVVAKAALSKARRDAIFSVVPRALCRSIELEARRVAIGDATTMEKRRTGVLKWIEKLGIDIARVYAALGVNGADDLGLEQLATLTGLKTAIKDGEVTVDESFPKLTDDSLPTGRGAAGLKEHLHKGEPGKESTGAPAGDKPAATKQDEKKDPPAQTAKEGAKPEVAAEKKTAKAKPEAQPDVSAMPAGTDPIPTWTAALEAQAVGQPRLDFIERARKLADIPPATVAALDNKLDELVFAKKK